MLTDSTQAITELDSITKDRDQLRIGAALFRDDYERTKANLNIAVKALQYVKSLAWCAGTEKVGTGSWIREFVDVADKALAEISQTGESAGGLDKMSDVILATI